MMARRLIVGGAFLIREVDYIKGGNGIVSGIKRLSSL